MSRGTATVPSGVSAGNRQDNKDAARIPDEHIDFIWIFVGRHGGPLFMHGRCGEHEALHQKEYVDKNF